MNEQIELSKFNCFLLLISQKQKHPERKGWNFGKGVMKSEPTQGSELLQLMNKWTTRREENQHKHKRTSSAEILGH